MRSLWGSQGNMDFDYREDEGYRSCSCMFDGQGCREFLGCFAALEQGKNVPNTQDFLGDPKRRSESLC